MHYPDQKVSINPGNNSLSTRVKSYFVFYWEGERESNPLDTIRPRSCLLLIAPFGVCESNLFYYYNRFLRLFRPRQRAQVGPTLTYPIRLEGRFPIVSTLEPWGRIALPIPLARYILIMVSYLSSPYQLIR